MMRANNSLSTLLRCLFQAELKRPVKVGAPLMNSWMIKFAFWPSARWSTGWWPLEWWRQGLADLILNLPKHPGGPEVDGRVLYSIPLAEDSLQENVRKLWFTDPILQLMFDTCVAFRVCQAWVTDLWSGVNPIRSASCDCSSSCSLIHSLIHSQMVSFPPDYQSCIQPAQNPSLQ